MVAKINSNGTAAMAKLHEEDEENIFMFIPNIIGQSLSFTRSCSS